MVVDTVLGEAELSQIAAACGGMRLIGSRGIAAPANGTRYLLETNRGKVLLKVDALRRQSDIKREIDLLLFLRKHEFPCPEPVAGSDGRHCREWDGRCVSLYRYIDGHSFTSKHAIAQIQSAGRALANLHAVGKAYKRGCENRFNFDRVADMYAAVRARLPSHFKSIIRTLDDEAGYLKHYLEQKLPRGIIHGDIFADHLLFKGQKVVGILDFEAAGRGKFIYDMAAAVNALCFEGTSYALRKFEAFVGGYESLRTLSLAEWDAFPNELRFASFRFAVTRLREFFERAPDKRRPAGRDFREPYECLRVLRRERDGGMEGLLMAMATGYDYRKYQRVRALERKGRS